MLDQKRNLSSSPPPLSIFGKNIGFSYSEKVVIVNILNFDH